ncbi:MAG: hypothetical protein WBV95_09740, partial [Desulfobacterales bacterium]
RRPNASTSRARRQSLLRVHALADRLCRPRQLLWEGGALKPASLQVTVDTIDGLTCRLHRTTPG